MGKYKTFEINVSKISKDQTHSTKKTTNNVEEFRESIKAQYNELISFQDIDITKENKEKLERLILATEDLIDNCMNDDLYSGNRDQYFVNLIFICHRLSLRIETYKLEEKISNLEDKSDNINKSQEMLEEKQEKAEEQSNNLIYNILGFIASFSIVSAAVVGISNIKGTDNIILFMTFCAFILLTTLIGLNNFYKNKTRGKNPLKSNYFLWWALLIIIIVIGLYDAIQYIKENKDSICEGIGRGIAIYQEGHKEQQ